MNNVIKNTTAVFALFVIFGQAFGAEGSEINPWMPVVGEAISLALQIIAPALTILVTALVWKLLGKFGVEKDIAIDGLIRTYIKQGINYADGWAEKQSEKPTGDEKMIVAIKHILGLVSDSKLPQIAEDKLKEMIESQLSFDKKNISLDTNSKSKVING